MGHKIHDFGTIFPGNSYTTAVDCTVAFGSSNSSSTLRMYQRDSGGVAMTGGPATGLVGWWPLNGNMVDASTGSNAMTITAGAPGFAAGQPDYGQALTFNGTSDGAAIPWRSDYDLDSYTVDLWFRTPAVDPGGANIITQKGNAGTNRNFGLWLRGTGLTAGLAEGGIDTQISTPSAPYVDNQWHHAALVVDSTSSPKTMTLYVDGVNRAATTFTGVVAKPASEIQVGYNPASPCGTCHFEGQIDELRVQNVSRTANDVRTYYLGAVRDYQQGVNDWLTPSVGFFGACLRTVTGTSVTGVWPTNATCPKTDGLYWKPVSTTSGGATATIAQSPTSGTTNGTANIRFGYRTLPDQPPGSYIAPVVFEVIAPNV